MAARAGGSVVSRGSTATRPRPAGETAALVLVMAHRDGHAAMVATGGLTDEFVRDQQALFRAVGITGWSLKRLPLGQAVQAWQDGRGCPVCAMVLPCGCLIEPALAGKCPHGATDRIHRIAHKIGVCSNDHPNHSGPPL